MMGLRVFEAAARHLSFSRAAQELCLTQGAVSRQIRSLEKMLNLELFLRVRNHLVLSEAGATYLPEVRATLSRIEAATLELLAHRGTGGVLNLAILPTFGTKWLIPRMTSFWRSHPNIVVNFATRAVAFDFTKERVDAAIHFGDISWPGVVAVPLMGEEVVLACSPALLQEPGLIQVQDLEHHTLLQHTTRPDAWVEWLAAAGGSTIDGLRGPRFEHFSMVIQAAIAGIGAAVLPRFLIEDEVTAGRLVIPLNIAVRSELAYYLVYPEEKRDLPALRTFRDWLLTEVRETAGASECPSSAVGPRR